ncbi:MAG: hypothetical protein AYK19_15200 [Theionarchaea archaeon DG-70-1]|nr:MAG: hypothetical protein AYK19_15200 [Theionarchaea archaeon DG-70-1]
MPRMCVNSLWYILKRISQSVLAEKLANLRDLRWSSRFAYYFLLGLVFLASCILFSRYRLFHTDVDSARYMLSALIQSEAAVIAVVVSLSLVAVQLTASSYSPKVLEIFRKNPDLWLLLDAYIGTIIYSLIVLKTIKEVNSEAIPEIHIMLSCFYGFFCFTALIPYTYNVLVMLRPSSIIKALSERIDRESLLKGDPIHPIIDVMVKSIGKYDAAEDRDPDWCCHSLLVEDRLSSTEYLGTVFVFIIFIVVILAIISLRRRKSPV